MKHIILFVLSIPLFVNAQFVREYKSDSSIYAEHSFETANGDFIMLGKIANNYFGEDSYFWAQRIDETGDVIWSKQYHSALPYSYDGMHGFQNSEDELVIQTTLTDENHSFTNSILLFLDNDGNEITTVSEKDSTYALTMTRAKDGSIISVFMESVELSSGDTAHAFISNLYLSKRDPIDGSLIWQNKIVEGIEIEDEGKVSIIEMDDQSYRIIASTEGIPNVYDYENDIRMIGVDSTGEVMMNKSLLDEYVDVTLWSVTKTLDNSFLINGSDYYNEKSFINKFDASGNEIWKNELTIGGWSSAYNSIALEDSSFITNLVSIDTLGEDKAVPSFLYIDKNGDTTGSKLMDFHTDSHGFLHMFQTRNKLIMQTGIVDYYSEDLVSALAMLSDVNGDTLNVVGVEESFDQTLSIYPNPTSGQINLNMETLQPNAIVTVRNLMGQITQQFNAKSSFELEGAKGVYLVEILDGDRREVFKVVKE